MRLRAASYGYGNGVWPRRGAEASKRHRLCQRSNKAGELLTLFDAIVPVLSGDYDDHENVEPITPRIEPQIPKGTRILLVEDNEINQDVAVGLLESGGLMCEIAENGEIAVRKIRDHEYDVVLMDMQMPIMDGIEATKNIRAEPRFRTLPIIAMTANAMASDRERCIQAGMNDFITKPIDPNELFGVIRQWIGVDRAFKPHSATSAVECGVRQSLRRWR